MARATYNTRAHKENKNWHTSYNRPLSLPKQHSISNYALIYITQQINTSQKFSNCIIGSDRISTFTVVYMKLANISYPEPEPSNPSRHTRYFSARLPHSNNIFTQSYTPTSTQRRFPRLVWIHHLTVSAICPTCWNILYFLNSIQFMFIYVPIQQPAVQLQKQHNIHKHK